MRLGRLHISGPQTWPDHILSYETGNLLVGVVAQVRGYAVGFEVQGRHGNPWSLVYLGAWAFELYLDADGSWASGEIA